MKDDIKNIFSKILHLLYPPRCMVCQSIIEVGKPLWFCGQCYANIIPIQNPVCKKCGAQMEDDDSEYCPDCRLAVNSIKIERNYSFMVYDHIARDLIHNFKYRGYKDYGEGLVNIISEKMGLGFVRDVDLIIPVPLHKKRLSERGFNQAEALAYHISKKTSKPIITDVLVRNRDTAKQSAIDHRARRSNISGAFSVVNYNKIRDKKIILIDDIYTSGSTISECAGVLLSEGAKSVISFTVCKTVRKK